MNLAYRDNNLTDLRLGAVYHPRQHAYIYALSDPVTKQVRYVGKTLDLAARYNGHLKENSKTHKCNWIQSLIAQGLKPEIDVVDICSPDGDEWVASERNWIANFKAMGYPLTNNTDGGDSGYKFTTESCEKVKASIRARTPERRAEICRKISLAKTGSHHSEDVRARLSKIAKNRTPEHQAKLNAAAANISDETRSKMRAAALAISDDKKAKIAASIRLRHKEGYFKNITSPEAIAKSAAKRTGQKRSPETRMAISAKAKLRWANPENRKQFSIAKKAWYEAKKGVVS